MLPNAVSIAGVLFYVGLIGIVVGIGIVAHAGIRASRDLSKDRRNRR